MRKRDREVREFSEIVDIVNRSQVMRMATCGEPYIVPLSFGYEAEDGVLTLYFHCAAEGSKLDRIARDDRVCLEWDILHGYAETGHSVTADYESVVAFGRASRCTGEERVKGLKLLLEHTGMTAYSAEDCAALPIVEVYKIVCDSVTGKRRFPKN